tara:strand:- start:1622 stop:1861 length:240 start_codon:yes stop_codon:yes gene_type:complete
VKKEHKSKTGGLTRAGRAYFKRTQGSNLKPPVTGKVKRGSKAAKRRKSFCARMSGVKGPMRDSKGRPTRKALALRKWKC